MSFELECSGRFDGQEDGCPCGPSAPHEARRSRRGLLFQKAKLRGDVPHASQELSDLPKNDDICNNPDEKIDDGKVGYFAADEDFQEYPESDTEDEDDVEDAVQPETPLRLAPADNAPPTLNLPDAAPASPANAYAGRVTRGITCERDFQVKGYPLPDHCPTSKRYWKATGK